MHLADTTIPSTGGIGSFGTRLLEMLPRHHQPHVVRVFSRDPREPSEPARVEVLDAPLL
jgi:hypothetical protein